MAGNARFQDLDSPPTGGVSHAISHERPLVGTLTRKNVDAREG